MFAHTDIEINADYEKRLKKFEKYKKQGIDLAFRCNSCGKLVVNSDIIFEPHACRRCGKTKLYSITADLTWFGILYCLFFSWLHEQGGKDESNC